MSLNDTTTKKTTVRDLFNSGILGNEADAVQRAPLGDILSVLLDAANPNVVVAATTVGGAVANTGVTSPANASYTQADQTAIATCVLALVVQINLIRTDLLAIRAELASALTGTMGGATETGVTVSTYTTATLAARASSIISVRSTAGTLTGVLTLVRDPTKTLVSGEVFWDGMTGLKFAAVDAITSVDLIYSKYDGSQKVSALLAAATPIV